MLAARTGMNWPGAKEPGGDFPPCAADDWCLPEFPTRPSGVIAMRRWPRQFRRKWLSQPSAVGRAGGARELSRLVASVDPVDRTSVHVVHDLCS